MQGRPVIYLDETWVNQYHTAAYRWTDHLPGKETDNHRPMPDAAPLPPKITANRGQRIIVLHAGCAKYGLLDNCELVFQAKKADGDYHGEMNGTTFMDWFENTLMPNLREPCVIVMDNASYHNVMTENSRSSSSNSRKGEMVQWLQDKGIPVFPSLTKPESTRSSNPASLSLYTRPTSLRNNMAMQS